jgi:hypothetical protein
MKRERMKRERIHVQHVPHTAYLGHYDLGSGGELGKDSDHRGAVIV